MDSTIIEGCVPSGLLWPSPQSAVIEVCRYAHPGRPFVEICAGDNAPPGTFAFPSYFQVHFADGSAIGSSGTAKQPNLEVTPLKLKQCARGWIQFAIVAGQHPVAIHYHELSKDKKPIDWVVKPGH